MTGADIRHLMVLVNNTAPFDLVREVFPDSDEFYVNAKASLCHKDPIRWMSSLDDERLKRLAALVNHEAERAS